MDPPSTPSPSRPLPPTLVGRDHEQGVLHTRLDAAREGRGGVLLVVGEPGIGKTSLVEALAEHAQRETTTVLRGRCWEGGGAPPFWPWIEVLRGITRMSSDAVPRDAAETLVEGAESSSSTERFTRFGAVVDLLAARAATTPVLVVLEDLHAADEPSLHLLRYVSREARSHRLFVVGTFRDTDVAPGTPVGQLLSALTSDNEVLRPAALDDDAVATLVAVHGGGLDGEALGAIQQSAGGNPFFITQLLRLGPDEDVTVIPMGVRGAVRSRVDRLPPDTVDMLTIAAVTGPEVPVPLLCQLTDTGPRAVVDALEPAVRAGLLVEAGVGRVRFGHGLVRETLYEDLGVGERAGLHARVVDALVALHGGSHEDRLPQIAHHAVASLPVGDGNRALDYTVAAAEQAIGTLAFEEAARLYASAADTAELIGRSAEERLGLSLAAADALSSGGHVGPARERYRAIADEAGRRGLAVIQANAVIGYGSVALDVWLGDERDVLQRAALDVLPADEDGLRARLLAQLAYTITASPRRRPGDAAALAREALGTARRSGDVRALHDALFAHRYTLIGDTDEMTSRIAVSRELLESAQAAGDLGAVLRARGHLIVDLLAVGDPAFRDEIERFESEAIVSRDPLSIWRAKVYAVVLSLLAARFTEARGLADEAVAYGGAIGEVMTVAVMGIHYYVIHEGLDELEELDRLMSALPPSFLGTPVSRCAAAWLAWQLGRHEEGRSVLHDLAADGFARIPRDASAWYCALGYLSEIAVASDDRPAMERLRELLRPHRGVIVHAGGWAVLGTVDHHLGRLSLALGDVPAAVDHLERSIDGCGPIGAEALAASSRLALADAVAAMGDVRRASHLREEVAGTADRLGAVRLARLARQQLGDRDTVEARADPSINGGPVPVVAVVLEREGDYWSLTADDRVVRLRDTKGLRYLALLLERPDTEFHVLDLVAAVSGVDPDSRNDRSADLGLSREGDMGAVLDEAAKAAYRRRIEDLEDEIAEATRFNDLERRSRAEEERAFIVEELARAVGLGGRDRPSGSHVEQSRVNVTKAIKTALRKVAEVHPDIGAFLASAVRTGTYCSFAPSQMPTVRWSVTSRQ